MKRHVTAREQLSDIISLREGAKMPFSKIGEVLGIRCNCPAYDESTVRRTYHDYVESLQAQAATANDSTNEEGEESEESEEGAEALGDGEETPVKKKDDGGDNPEVKVYMDALEARLLAIENRVRIEHGFPPVEVSQATPHWEEINRIRKHTRGI